MAHSARLILDSGQEGAHGLQLLRGVGRKLHPELFLERQQDLQVTQRIPGVDRVRRR